MNISFNVLYLREFNLYQLDDVFEMLVEQFVLPLNGHLEEDLAYGHLEVDAWHEEEEVVMIQAVDTVTKEVEVYGFSHLVDEGRVMVCSCVVIDKVVVVCMSLVVVLSVVSLVQSVVQVALVQDSHNFRVVQVYQVVPENQVDQIILQNLAYLERCGNSYFNYIINLTICFSIFLGIKKKHVSQIQTFLHYKH